jgi:hypothetical protein
MTAKRAAATQGSPDGDWDASDHPRMAMRESRNEPQTRPDVLALGFSNHDHWARSVVDDLLADRAQQKARKASATTVADNEEVRVSRLLQQDVRGLPFDRNALTLQGRLQASYNRNRLTHDILCTVAKHPDYRRVHSWREPAGICSRGDLPRADDAKSRSMRCGLGSRKLESCPPTV